MWGSCTLDEVEGHDPGDMNLDGFINGDDAADFALGLTNPTDYEDDHCTLSPVETGNFVMDDVFDFDDIEDFLALVGGGLIAADIFAPIDTMSVPEPTSCGLLLLGSCLLGATRSRRLRHSVRRSG